MGFKLFRGYEDEVTHETIIKEVKISNPDPEKFEIIKIQKVKNYIVAFIKYPDCTNYEGNKILVFKNMTIKQIKYSTHIDPHFERNRKNSPIARFEPTQEGWHMAIFLANNYSE